MEGGISTRATTRSDLGLEHSGLGRGLSFKFLCARNCPGAWVMSAWAGQDQRGRLGGGGPRNTGGLRRNQLKSLQVETAQERRVLPTSQLPPLSPAPTHRGWSPGRACGPRPPHCSPRTQTGLSPGGWGLQGAGHWRAGTWGGQTDGWLLSVWPG